MMRNTMSDIARKYPRLISKFCVFWIFVYASTWLLSWIISNEAILAELNSIQ